MAPINVTAEYVDRISKGDIPPKITDTYNGDFNEIKNNLNNCIDGLGGLVEANAVLQKMAVNDYTANVEGNYQGIYADVGKAVNTVEGRIHHVTETVKHVANGDISDLKEYQKVGRRSEKDQLVPSLTQMMEAIERLILDANMLSEAAVAGKLATRADGSRHQGEFRKVVDGVNKTLDAVIDPVNEAMRVSNEYAKQNFGCRVDENLKVNGDFVQFKKSLNNVGIQVSRAMIKGERAGQRSRSRSAGSKRKCRGSCGRLQPDREERRGCQHQCRQERRGDQAGPQGNGRPVINGPGSRKQGRQSRPDREEIRGTLPEGYGPCQQG